MLFYVLLACLALGLGNQPLLTAITLLFVAAINSGYLHLPGPPVEHQLNATAWQAFFDAQPLWIQASYGFFGFFVIIANIGAITCLLTIIF